MKPHDVETYFSTHQRSALIVLAVLLVTAISGFFMGLRQTLNFSDQTRDVRDRQSNAEPLIAEEGEIPRAVSYSEMASASLRPNATWTNVLTQLPKAEETRQAVLGLTASERVDVLHAREARRAYDGAPPVIPHAITQRSAGACMTCHGDVGSQPVIAGQVPPRMSHAFFASCTQCHVSAQGLGDGVAQPSGGLDRSNGFKGTTSAGLGSRAYPGAPPTIPHHTLMRENCSSCHGPGRVNAITTTHPDRQSCTQCHAPSAAKDQRLLDLSDIRKPVSFPVDLTPPQEEVLTPEPAREDPPTVIPNHE